MTVIGLAALRKANVVYIMEVFLGFILGLCVGSFLNVVLVRYRKKETLGGRSQCRHCKHSLFVWDLIPLASFLVLGGKCRYCKEKISAQYPLVELATGALFAVLAHIYLPALPVYFTWLCGIALILLLIGIYDLKYKEIPDLFSIILFGVVVLGILLFFRDTIGVRFVAGVGLLSFFLLLYVVSRGRWIGGGDIKIAFPLGALAGWPGVVVLFMATYLLGLGVSLILLFTKRVGRKAEIPFAPFLLVGALISFFWSEALIRWYETLFYF